jgi:hypothetical protein
MNNCVICKDTIEFNKYEGTLVQNMHEVCYHVYHLECINKWIRSCHESGWEKTCPLCRAHWENLTN